MDFQLPILVFTGWVWDVHHICPMDSVVCSAFSSFSDGTSGSTFLYNGAIFCLRSFLLLKWLKLGERLSLWASHMVHTCILSTSLKRMKIIWTQHLPFFEGAPKDTIGMALWKENSDQEVFDCQLTFPADAFFLWGPTSVNKRKNNLWFRCDWI